MSYQSMYIKLWVELREINRISDLLEKPVEI